MPLSTSDSDKKFLYLLFTTIAAVALLFYFYVEKKSELMVRQKLDGRYIDFAERYVNEKFDVVTLGSSHAEKAGLIGLRSYPLSAPFSVPTVMYLKAKLIVKIHPEVKVVYLEADDHLLFKSPIYSLAGLSPQEKRQSKLFEWGGAFIDSDSEALNIFGEVSPSSQNPALLLENDIKPIILKRIVYGIFKNNWSAAKPVLPDNAQTDCSLSSYPDQLDLSQESHWSTLPAHERQRQSDVVIAQHGLNLADPLDPTQTDYFEKTIALLKNHHIDVVLVHYPEAPEFVAKKHPAGQVQYEAFIASMAAKYQLRRIDMRGYSHYGNRFFDDHDHIDDRFSAWLGRQFMEDFCTQVLKATP